MKERRQEKIEKRRNEQINGFNTSLKRQSHFNKATKRLEQPGELIAQNLQLDIVSFHLDSLVPKTNPV